MKTKKKKAFRPANYGTAKRCPHCGFRIRGASHESGEHCKQGARHARHANPTGK